MGDEDNDNPCADMIPDGKGMPLAWARVIVYLDPDGEERSSVDWMPGTSLVTVSGAIHRLESAFDHQTDRQIDDLNAED